VVGKAGRRNPIYFSKEEMMLGLGMMCGSDPFRVGGTSRDFLRGFCFMNSVTW